MSVQDRKKDSIVILMTACIDPNGMENTALQNPEIRKTQYLEAIDFYLKRGDFDVVFCENTGMNIFNEIASSQKYTHLEYLTFRGNDYDKQRGKSFGEARIIEYAIRNSQRLKSADFIIKITGRVKILNLNKLAKIALKRHYSALPVILELSSKDWANSVCFVAPKIWLLNTVEKYGELLYDIGYNFEKMLYRSIVENREIKIYPYYPQIDGICGANGLPYGNPSFYQRQLCHYNGLFHIYKSRGDSWNYITAKICWFLCIIRRKIFLFFKG